MKTFNAFQLTILFVAWPWLIQWLHHAEFYGAGALTIAAMVAYGIQFIGTIYAYEYQM